MEAKMTTKEKIIFESLKLFSSKGYDGVSMREIAAAVGIKGASLYNHFKGKEDIFHAIFSEMMKQYDNAAAMMNIPMEESDQTIIKYHNADENQLLRMAEGLFAFFTQNEFAVMFRKLLVSEQHKSSIAAKCYKEYYLEAPILFQSQIFRGLQQNGDFQNCDPDTMALHFYGPIYYILSKFDLGYPYADCLKQLNNHIHFFCMLYCK
jgi:AcrR family transcriptional regulator